MEIDILSALRKTTEKIKEYINNKLNDKVDKINGKVLSSNDYTDADKSAVESIPTDLLVIDDKLYMSKGNELLSSGAPLPHTTGIVNNLSGAIVSITDSAAPKISTIKIHGKSTQNITPRPSYPVEIKNVGDNGSVKNITCGKNLFGGQDFIDKIIESGGRYDSANNSVEIGGFKKVSDYDIFTGFNPKTQYTLIVRNTVFLHSSNISKFRFTYSDANYDSIVQFSGDEVVAFTTDEGKTVDKLQIYYDLNTTWVDPDYFGLFEGVITIDQYEEYKKNNTQIITIPEPLRGVENYNDTLTICSDGSGTIERNIGDIIVDETTCDEWTYYPVDRCFYKPTEFIGKNNSVMCNVLKPLALYESNSTDGRIYFEDGSLCLRIDDSVNSIEALKTYVSTSPIYILGALTAPIVEQLTPEQVQGFLQIHDGITNIRNTDGADIEVEYIADTKLYIDNKISELVAGGN